MSTEARRAPIPPRPPSQPRDGTRFEPQDAPAGPEEPTGPTATGSGSGSGPAGGGSDAVPGTATGAAPAPTDDGYGYADSADEPSVFTPSASTVSRPPAARSGTGAGTDTGSGSAVPGVTGPVTPPPPRASARFPDAPPSTGHAPRRDNAGTAVPPRPDQRPPFRPGRPAAPAETPSETTASLRPIPPVSGARPDGPAGRTSATTGRTRPAPSMPAAQPVVPAVPPRRPGAPAAPTSQPTAQPWSTPQARTALGTTRAGWGTSDPARAVGPASVAPGPTLSWGATAATRPVVSFGEPEGYDERGRAWPLGARVRGGTVAAAACLVLGLGLIGGAVTGSWLTVDGGDGPPGTGFTAAGRLWHSVLVDQLFPPVVQGTGAGPGGADRTWTRIAVAPDSGCADAFDPLLHKVLAPAGCQRLLRATYTDATQSYVTTVGLLFTKADAAGMSALAARFRDEHLDLRTDLMPRPYAARGTAAARFGNEQRASWTVAVLTDAPVVAFAVSGWADGRRVDEPQPAASAVDSGATSAPAQAGLGNEAQGLSDRIERRLRATVRPATGRSS
ncbi:hypothetical protein ACGFYV_00755 [Streptomyces sp. NPDC048297]|uniref:hypothetical protein n=1 Tax=Streptomyces sp. NPDC048297 TaxID=3365531 RepID=UPI00371C8608